MYEYKIIYDASNQAFKDMHGCDHLQWDYHHHYAGKTRPVLPGAEEALNWYASQGWRLQAMDSSNNWYLERWIDEADRPYKLSEE